MAKGRKSNKKESDERSDYPVPGGDGGTESESESQSGSFPVRGMSSRIVIYPVSGVVSVGTFTDVSSLIEQGMVRADLWTVRTREELVHVMDRYINLIIIDGARESAIDCELEIAFVRKIYQGLILLINDDPTVSSCQWGRRWFVDEVCTLETLTDTVIHLLSQAEGAGRTALVLAGGGILGGYNELGSLAALADYGISKFDVYIGLSAGAFVAACAANQIDPLTAIRRNTLGLMDYYSPNLDEVFSKILRFLPRAGKRFYEYFTTTPHDILFLLSSLFTASPLSGDRLTRKLSTFLSQEGLTNDFRELRNQGIELYIVAMDLDTTERRVFGEGLDCSVSIAEAVAASSALPVAYHPKVIEGRYFVDGGIHKTANIDVAIEHGADLIVCVNPLVPYTAGQPGFINDLGILGIIEQSYRTMLQRRLHIGLRHYALEYPGVTIVLIEPETNDLATFHNPLNAGPGMIEQAVLAGYNWTRRLIEARFDFIQRAFWEHGRKLNRDPANERYQRIAADNFSIQAIRRELFRHDQNQDR